MTISAIFFLGCNKTKQAESADIRSESTRFITLEQLTALNKQYNSETGIKNNTVLAPPNWKRTIVSDAIGASSGAFFGPFAAFCGGIVGSVGYCFYLSVNPTIPHPIPYSTNTDNPYDRFGEMHNETMAYLIDETFARRPYNLDMAIDSTRGYASNHFFDLLDKDVSNDNMKIFLNIIASEYSDENLLAVCDLITTNGYLSANENSIIKTYFTGFFNVADHNMQGLSLQSPLTYSIAAETIIKNSVELSETSKMKLLIGMSVTRNSYVLNK